MNAFILRDYYDNGTDFCPLHRHLCHAGNGTKGFVCEYFVGFECGDSPNKVFCEFEGQLTLNFEF